jgi:hypothetical protein
MWLYYILGSLFGLLGLIIVGEVITSKLPNSKFAGWWRRNVVAECQDCD